MNIIYCIMHKLKLIENNKSEPSKYIVQVNIAESKKIQYLIKKTGSNY